MAVPALLKKRQKVYKRTSLKHGIKNNAQLLAELIYDVYKEEERDKVANGQKYANNMQSN